MLYVVRQLTTIFRSIVTPRKYDDGGKAANDAGQFDHLFVVVWQLNVGKLVAGF